MTTSYTFRDIPESILQRIVWVLLAVLPGPPPMDEHVRRLADAIMCGKTDVPIQVGIEVITRHLGYLAWRGKAMMPSIIVGELNQTVFQLAQGLVVELRCDKQAGTRFAVHMKIDDEREPREQLALSCALYGVIQTPELLHRVHVRCFENEALRA